MVESSALPAVVVVGGGYAGIQAAKLLDAAADVVLVEPRDGFHHNVAALRALVDPSWLPAIFIPYGGLLQHGRVVRDRAIRVEDSAVVVASGERIRADYIVLATGSRYPFPAKIDSFDTHDAHVRYRAAHNALAQAGRVLLLGAGPVGIELAGEITSAWPDKSVVLVDSAPDLLAGPFSAAVRAELRRQLAERGIELALSSALRDEPPTMPGELGPFTVTTETGSQLSADLWFRCFGVAPVSDYLAEELSGARRADGHLDVTPTLQLVGHETVFAIGDVSAADRNMAGIAGRQAATAAGNILALIHGESDLTAWVPSPAVIIVPIGPDGGTGQLPGSDQPATAAAVSELKGRDLFVDRYAEILGATPASRTAATSEQLPATHTTSPG
jgi:NADH dehydrogenase FAD-containing subunit